MLPRTLATIPPPLPLRPPQGTTLHRWWLMSHNTPARPRKSAVDQARTQV